MKQRPSFKVKAQTASELAIFGAILIFVLAAIFRFAFNFNFGQNQALEAMRLAFGQSFISAEFGESSRVGASILFIEDRKDTDITGAGAADGKYGPLTRNPYVVSGAGSFTKNLFLPTDYGVIEELPTTDVFVNGRHFTFTTAGYKCVGSGCPENFMETRAECEPGAGYSCPILYTRITKINQDFNETDEARFDLDRLDATSCGGCSFGADVPSSLRDEFNWQWLDVGATTEAIAVNEGDSIAYDVDGDLEEEQILGTETAGGRYWLSDILRGDAEALKLCRGLDEVIIKVNVLDAQEGDLDLTYNTFDANGGDTPAEPSRGPQVRPGLRDVVRFYTCPSDRCATTGEDYLWIEEGKLYAPGDTRQFIRSVQKHDHIDMIERQIQLSNDTGRLCDATGNPSLYNPAVEACNDCYGAANVDKTCFDETTLILYVRSRLADITGRKWITDVSRDEMVIP